MTTEQTRPHLTVDCVIFSEQGLVLIKRLSPPFEGHFALPGGFVEIGETVEDLETQIFFPGGNRDRHKKLAES